jgi:hypothetical protein
LGILFGICWLVIDFVGVDGHEYKSRAKTFDAWSDGVWPDPMMLDAPNKYESWQKALGALCLRACGTGVVLGLFALFVVIICRLVTS